MELFGLDVTPREFQRVQMHIAMRYIPGEWNGLSEDLKRAEVADILLH